MVKLQSVRSQHACRYDLRTIWRVPGTVADVAQVLLRSELMPLWWRTFSKVTIVAPGASDGKGRVVRVTANSLLPYTLRFRCQVTEVIFPQFFQVDVWGDFCGRGSGRLEQHADEVAIFFEWRVDVQKPSLRRWSFLMKPMFVFNHQWSMYHGQRGLMKELRRRQALSIAG